MVWQPGRLEELQQARTRVAQAPLGEDQHDSAKVWEGPKCGEGTGLAGGRKTPKEEEASEA